MRAITLSRPQTNTEPALNYSWIISRYNLDVFLDFGREAIQELVIKYTKTLRDDPDKKYKRSTVHNRIAPIPPQSWIKSHPNDISIPQSKEIVPPDTLKQQINIAQDWFATNWSGVCGQLSKISVPTLVITGTEDISAPAANSLIIAQKIPGTWLVQIKGAGHGLMYQYPDKLSTVLQTSLSYRLFLG